MFHSDDGLESYFDPVYDPQEPSEFFYGRGGMNLKHSTEYARFGKAVYGYKDSHKIFLERPSLIKDTTRFVFLSAFYKYMTPIYPKPSAHQVVTA